MYEEKRETAQPRVVLDTNVLVAAFLSPSGVNAQVLYLAGQKYELCLPSLVLEELRGALSSPPLIKRYGYSQKEVERFVWDLRSASCPASCGPSITVVGDPSDDLVLGCAIAIGAEYIVSNDKSFLRVKEYQGIRIFSPNEFLTELCSQTSTEKATSLAFSIASFQRIGRKDRGVSASNLTHCKTGVTGQGSHKSS